MGEGEPRTPSSPMTAVSCSSLRIGTYSRPSSGTACAPATPSSPASRIACAIAASSAGSEGRIWRVRPPTFAFSSSTPPRAMIFPRSITVSSLASCSASSMYCVVSRTVAPSATIRCTSSQTSLRVRGSSPVVGSSR